MNIKSLLALAAAAIVGQASATVGTSNILCRIHVASTEASTIVAVPLVTVGTGASISPDSLVSTNNLSNGDSILRWNTSSKKWEAWEIKDGAWTSVNTLKYFNLSDTPIAGSTALAKGEAIWVNRTADELSAGFYIYGQVSTSGTTSTTTGGGSASAPVYTLIGNTSLGDVALNDITVSDAVDGDIIVWGDKTQSRKVAKYFYKSGSSGGWGEYVGSKETVTVDGETFDVLTTTWTKVADTVVVPAGQGVWYIGVGTKPVTITWASAD